MQVNEMVEPITRDNIEQFLEYNEIDKELYNLSSNTIDTNNALIRITNPKLLQLLEIEFDKKLKPLPKPKFDFKQYLLDNGFKGDKVWLYLGILSAYPNINNNPSKNCKTALAKGGSSSVFIDQTKENADILIKMAKLSEGLK